MTAVLGALLGAAAKGGVLSGVGRLVEIGSPAAVRHALWTVVLAGHLAFLGASPLSPVWHVSVPFVPDSPVAGLGSEGIDPSERVPVRAGAGAEAPARAPGDAGKGVVSRSASPSESWRSEAPSWPAYLVVVWATGALVFLLRAVRHLQAGLRWIERAERRQDRSWDEQLASARRALRLSRPVEIRYLEGLRTPMVLGPFRPVLLLPPRARVWSEERRRAVVLHELAHVARFDDLWRGLAHLVRALFWFDPLVWYAVRRLEAEAESACDAAAVRRGASRERYVEELVEIVREARGRPSPGLASSLGRRRGLEARARRLLTARIGERRGVGRPPVALSVTGGCLAILALAGPEPERDAPGPEVAVSGSADEPPSGCVYDGGLHRNVVRATEAESPVWRVGWNGADCRVRFEARGSHRTVEGRGLVPATGSVRITVTGRRPITDLELVRSRPGGRLDVRFAGRPVTGPRRGELLAWNDAFARELARHTGHDAPERVRRLLSQGGVAAVLSEVEVTSGDHAGGVYLRELVNAHELTREQVRRVLGLASARVENEAVLSGLLGDVAARHPVGGPELREAYLTAVGALETRAGRAAALSALDASPRSSS